MFDYWQDGFLHGLLYWIYHMQGLLGGLLALAGAFGTIYILRKQLIATHSHREDDLKKTHTADMIEVTWWSMKIGDYLSECREYILGLEEAKHSKTLGFYTKKTPNFPTEALPYLARLSRNLDQKGVEKIRSFVALLQIQNSRFRSLHSDFSGGQKMDDGTLVHTPYVLSQAKADYFYAHYENNRILKYCRGNSVDINDLMTAKRFLSEAKFAIGFLDDSEIEFIYNLWPKNGWWHLNK